MTSTIVLLIELYDAWGADPPAPGTMSGHIWVDLVNLSQRKLAQPADIELKASVGTVEDLRRLGVEIPAGAAVEAVFRATGVAGGKVIG